MKLERLSENQIRCTLYKSDLADKELHLTEHMEQTKPKNCSGN